VRNADELKDLPVVMFQLGSQVRGPRKGTGARRKGVLHQESEWEEFVAISRKICSLAHPAKPRHRSSDADARHIDYCLHLLGIRVRKDACHLIAKGHDGMGDDRAVAGPPRRSTAEVSCVGGGRQLYSHRLAIRGGASRHGYPPGSSPGRKRLPRALAEHA